MIEGLSKRISGDWTDLSQAGLSPDGLAGYFEFPPPVIASIVKNLSSSVEHGPVEYKEKILNPFFGALEDMKFKSVSFEELGRQGVEIGKALLVTMIERLFAAGAIDAAGEGTPAAESGPRNDLKSILADVMARIRDDPSLKTNKSVKLILTQLAIYQRERETMEKLLPNIRDPDKAAASRRNFQRTFGGIAANIAKHYAAFLEEERLQTARKERLDLTVLNWKSLLPLFTKEARELLRLYSTLRFALEGKYKVREICVHMYNEKRAFFKMLEEESAALMELAAGIPGGQQLPAALVTEMVAVMERMMDSGLARTWRG
jgi:hypothetical protein